jgi:hypothetical protein
MIIPIFHSKRELSNHNSSCSRTHDRLWHTAHKTQGIIFPCAVLKIGNGDFAPGLAAISRVKSPLLFRESRVLRKRGKGLNNMYLTNTPRPNAHGRLTPIASSVHSPPSQITRYCPSNPCYTAPPLDPTCIKRKTSSQDFCGGGPGAQ